MSGRVWVIRDRVARDRSASGGVRACAAAACVLLLAPAAAQDKADAQAGASEGRRIFVSGTQPSCPTCHELADAGAAGRIGPSLDEMRPEPEQVQRAVLMGIGGMPAFKDQLSEAQIEAVAKYVAQAAKR